MRKEIPLLITLILGITYVVAEFLPFPMAVNMKSQLDQWFLIATAFAVLLGIISLTRLHAKNILLKKSGNYTSYVLLASAYTMAAIGIVQGTSSHAFTWLYNNVMLPLNATQFSLVAFYLASAAYRAFRVRNVDATILLIVGVIVMLGKAPIGELIWPSVPQVSSWLLAIPNTAGMRGITIGATLGGVAMALKIVAGLERGYLGSGQ